jgi:Ecdysteroid kinase-like family
MVDVNLIKELYEQDRKSGRLARNPGELPIDYEAITPEWLTHILCKDHQEAKVVGYSLGERDDGSANRRRVMIEYNDAGRELGLPSSVFCKASHDLLNRINLGVCGAAHGEVTFYNKVRPLLDLEIPESFFAAYDPQSFNSMVMLRDIGGEAEFCDHATAISKDEAVGQIRLMARYHGQLEENPECNAGTTGQVTWPMFFAACCNNGVEEFSNKGFLAAQEVIPARLYARYDEIWPATLASVEIHNSLRSTLVHGDCHLKQWYKIAGKMGLADWQCSCFGSWARDYAYAMTTSLKVEDRRRWERELLAQYLEEFASAGGHAPSFDEAWRLYRINMMSALCWWTVTLTPSPGMPEMQPRETSLEFIRRMAHAVDDLDVLDLFK